MKLIIHTDPKNGIEIYFQYFRSTRKNHYFIRIFLIFFFIGKYQFRRPTFVKKPFFDNFNFKDNLFPKSCRQIVTFASLTTSTEIGQKTF